MCDYVLPMETPLVRVIEGMSCGSCAAAVDRALRSVEGVKSVKVDVAAGRAEVVGPRLDRAALARAVYDAGYDVRP